MIDYKTAFVSKENQGLNEILLVFNSNAAETLANQYASSPVKLSNQRWRGRPFAPKWRGNSERLKNVLYNLFYVQQ